MAARRRGRGGSVGLPPTARRAPDNEGAPCAFCRATSAHERSPRPTGARSNAITRAPPAAGLYDARSNYRRHTLSTMESTLETRSRPRHDAGSSSAVRAPRSRRRRDRQDVGRAGDTDRERSNFL